MTDISSPTRQGVEYNVKNTLSGEEYGFASLEKK
jgi:hypothetical protein